MKKDIALEVLYGQKFGKTSLSTHCSEKLILFLKITDMIVTEWWKSYQSLFKDITKICKYYMNY